MATQRAHILLPEDLIQEIDEAVGPRGRSAFLVETAREALRRRKLLAFLKKSETSPAWKAENHPELAKGSEAWIRKIRQENEGRIKRVEKARKASH
ncbi:MAG TPA: hypothetical protein VGN16_26115 [Acidobacteriaceae bacterium]